jgi:hypothetical protein
MKKIVVGLAIVAFSTTAAFAAHSHHHAMKPKQAAASTSSPNVFVPGGVSAADKALYMKNEHDSGMKKK